MVHKSDFIVKNESSRKRAIDWAKNERKITF